MVTKLLRIKRHAKKRADKGSLGNRLGSVFENAPDPNPLINIASFFLVLGGVAFLLVSVLISEAVSHIMKFVTAPFRRGNQSPPSDDSAS